MSKITTSRHVLTLQFHQACQWLHFSSKISKIGYSNLVCKQEIKFASKYNAPANRLLQLLHNISGCFVQVESFELCKWSWHTLRMQPSRCAQIVYQDTTLYSRQKNFRTLHHTNNRKRRTETVQKNSQNSTSSEMKTFPSPSLISKHPFLGCKHRFQNTSTIENYHTVRKVGGKIIGSVDKVQVRALSAQLNDVQGEEPLICNP